MSSSRQPSGSPCPSCARFPNGRPSPARQEYAIRLLFRSVVRNLDDSERPLVGLIVDVLPSHDDVTVWWPWPGRSGCSQVWALHDLRLYDEGDSGDS